MNRRILVSIAVFAALPLGCVIDARAPYEGTYAVTAVQNFTVNGVTQTTTVQGSLTVTAGPDASRITLNDGACAFTAVVNGNSFIVDPTTCPAVATTSTSGAACNSTLTIQSGSGSRSANTIAVSLTGTEAFSCNDGSSGSGPISESISGSK